jgi:hypothetical protein
MKLKNQKDAEFKVAGLFEDLWSFIKIYNYLRL